jgi:hypothetical protein
LGITLQLDLQTLTLVALITNTIVNCFLAYLYRFRVKIEQKQTKIQEENAIARRELILFRKHIKLEKEEILKLNKKELREFLDDLEHLGED